MFSSIINHPRSAECLRARKKEILISISICRCG